MKPLNFEGDRFEPRQLPDCRTGDIVRIGEGLCQVLHTLGFVLVARNLATGERRNLTIATIERLKKRVGEPLPVEW